MSPFVVRLTPFCPASENFQCGLENLGNPALAAAGNYWGAATGPGADPADAICNLFNGTTITTPFATGRFAINPGSEP